MGFSCLWSPIRIRCSVALVRHAVIWDSNTSAASSAMTIFGLSLSSKCLCLAAPVVVMQITCAFCSIFRCFLPRESRRFLCIVLKSSIIAQISLYWQSRNCFIQRLNNFLLSVNDKLLILSRDWASTLVYEFNCGWSIVRLLYCISLCFEGIKVLLLNVHLPLDRLDATCNLFLVRGELMSLVTMRGFPWSQTPMHLSVHLCMDLSWLRWSGSINCDKSSMVGRVLKNILIFLFIFLFNLLILLFWAHK